MHILTAHDGRMPSPDKSQSKSHLGAGSQEAIPLHPDEISFNDTFAGLPARDQSEEITNQNLLTSPEILSADSLQTEVTAQDIAELTEDTVELNIDIVNAEHVDIETGLAETVLTDAATQPHGLETTAALDIAAPPRNSRDVSIQMIERPTSSDLTGRYQEQPTSNRIAAKDEIGFESLPRYIKSVGESALHSQESLTRFQSLMPTSDDGGFRVTQTNLAIPGSPTPLQSSTLIQAPQALQVLTVPMRDVAQNVVQATLNQERTMIRIDPPELGRIQLDFDHSGSGKTIVTLSAEIDSVKLMLIERRAFMIGLFEGHGFDDVEIRIDNDLDADAKSSGGQLFSNQDAPSQYIKTSDSSDTPLTQEDGAKISLTGNTASPSQLTNNRLHIRV